MTKNKKPVDASVDVSNAEQPTEKVLTANVDGAIVHVKENKVYSNGETGATIAKNNPARKSKAKATTKKSKKTTATKKKTEDGYKLPKGYWKEYYSKNKNKYAVWNKLWREKKKAEKLAEQKKTTKSSKKK